MSSSIAAGLSVNTSRPTTVSSQLHTPLTAKPISEKKDETQRETSSIGSMAAVKRETNIIDPLSRLTNNAVRNDNESFRIDSKDKQLSENVIPQQIPIVYTAGELFLMKMNVPPIEISTIPVSISGIQTLASLNAWKHVVEMSEKLLHTTDSSFNPEISSFNLVFRLRMIAFFRLKMFDELVQEAGVAIADEENRISNLMNEVYNISQTTESHGFNLPKQGICNSDKVLALQLLLIEARTMTGRGEEALQQLYALRKWLSNEKSPIEWQPQVNEEILWWKWRIQWSIINTLAKQRQWRQTIFELQSILRDVQWKRSKGESNTKTPLSFIYLLSSEVIILCRLSRTLLQMGAIDAADNCAQQSITLLSKVPSLRGTYVFDHTLLAQGLVLFARDKIEEALQLFSTVITNESSRKSQEKIESPLELLFPNFSHNNSNNNSNNDNNNNNEEFSLFRHPLAGVVEIEDSILAAATNNYSICSLYLRKIKEAVNKMEQLIQDDPTQNLIDPIVFNLCTMYDLSCSPDVSIEKKKALQEVANHYHIEDLHWKSFRLN